MTTVFIVISHDVWNVGEPDSHHSRGLPETTDIEGLYPTRAEARQAIVTCEAYDSNWPPYRIYHTIHEALFPTPEVSTP